jgi:hypothetical protein
MVTPLAAAPLMNASATGPSAQKVFSAVDAAVIPQQFVHEIPHRAPTSVLLDGASFRT